MAWKTPDKNEARFLNAAMADRYTFRKFTKKYDAILINYQYGDRYLFELVRKK